MNPRNSNIASLLVTAVAAIAVGLTAITSQSLWMDEGSTAFKALIPGLRDWWSMTLRLGGSDVQMPVYMFLTWVWNKFGANTEYAFRAINIPWILLGTLVLRRVKYWPLLFLTSPFVWYYTGELRPYAMQAAAGAAAAAAMIRANSGVGSTNRFSGLHATAAASILLACSSLTSAVWAAGLWLGVLVIRPDWPKLWGFWQRILPWTIAALGLGAYYTFTLVNGYRAAGSEGGLASMAFGIYELIGMSGLGPARDEIRSHPACLVEFLPVLLPASSCFAIAWILGVRRWATVAGKRTLLATACAVAFPLLILACVGVAMDFRVLGRHLSPVLPAVLLPIAFLLRSDSPARMLVKLPAIACVALSLTSAILLRTLPKHGRDDYRRASSIAFEALRLGRNVLWQADMNATRYYAYREGGIAMVQQIQTLESNRPESLMMTDLVVINRPDIRYKGTDYRKNLKDNFFKPVASFTGFEIWSSR